MLLELDRHVGELAIKCYAPPGSRLLNEIEIATWTAKLREVECSLMMLSWAAEENKCLQGVIASHDAVVAASHDAEVACLQPV